MIAGMYIERDLSRGITTGRTLMVRKKSETGFSMIELLTAMAIVSVLTALAFPRFSDYKYRAFNARSLSDLRETIRAQETHYTESERYVSCLDAGCSTVLPDFTLSDGTRIEVITRDDDQEFSAIVSNGNGDETYSYDSATAVTTTL